MVVAGLVLREDFPGDREVVPAEVLEDLALAAVRGEIVHAAPREVPEPRDANHADPRGQIPPDHSGPDARMTTRLPVPVTGVDVKGAHVVKVAAARDAGVVPVARLEVDLQVDLVGPEWEVVWSWIRWWECRMPASHSAVGCWRYRHCASGTWPM